MSTPVVRGWIVDGPGGVRFEKAEQPSQQLPDDPFAYTEGAESGLQRPLYDMDRLVSLVDGTGGGANALHARCVAQKASDILGRGITIRPKEDDAASEGQAQDAWGAFVQSVEDDDRGDGSLKERLTWAHEDYEGVGWAVLEVSRTKQGAPDGLWYVPGHTVRAHADGIRFAQKKGGKTVWFKRYGVEGTVDRSDGSWSVTGPRSKRAAGAELIVVRNHTPRSAYYGLPDHIPALGAIAGWRAQEYFNLKFFDNLAVPSYAVIIEGGAPNDDLEDTVVSHFRRLKGEPNKTLVLAVAGSQGDKATAPKIRFERLTVDVKDATHRLYKQDNALEICIAHGMPPYRVGWPLMGSMGGATAKEMTEIYISAMVQPRQETWEQRLTRAFLGEKGLAIAGWEVKAAELDVRDQLRDLEMAKARYDLGIETPNSIAAFLGADERKDPGGSAYIAVPGAANLGTTLAPQAPEEQDAAIAKWSTEVRELAALRERIAAMVPEASAS